MLINILILLLSLNSFASEDCTNVDLNQISDDKISEYTHCFKDANVTVNETPKAKSKLNFTPVCDRSIPIKIKLEKIFNTSCKQITKDMLFAYDKEFKMIGKEYPNPKLGDFSGMRRLKSLILNKNEIKIIPLGLFDDLRNLEILSLGYNQIEELPVNLFEKLLKLEYLRLSGNFIRTFPHGTFDASINLTTLYIGNNLINEIPMNIFDKLLKLKRLSFINNDITVLSNPILSSLGNSLEYLHLNRNPIIFISSSAFKTMSRLKFLDLSSTMLSFIGRSVFTPLESITRIDLHDILTQSPSLGIFDRLLNSKPLKTRNNLNIDNSLENEKIIGGYIPLDDISITQFTHLQPFPLHIVDIANSKSLLRNRNFIDQLTEKGVNVVE